MRMAIRAWSILQIMVSGIQQDWYQDESRQIIQQNKNSNDHGLLLKFEYEK